MRLTSRERMEPVLHRIPRPLRQYIPRRIDDRQEAREILVRHAKTFHVDFLVRVDDLIAQGTEHEVRFLKAAKKHEQTAKSTFSNNSNTPRANDMSKSTDLRHEEDLLLVRLDQHTAVQRPQLTDDAEEGGFLQRCRQRDNGKRICEKNWRQNFAHHRSDREVLHQELALISPIALLAYD
jgi:hypothetical protein